MADRIKNYQQEADQITTLKEIRTDLGVTPSSYTPDATVVTKDRVVTFAQAEEELVVLSDIEKGVKQQIVDVDIAQKDITNIKALLQGHLYDYQTDSTSAYTKSVPSGAMPYAGLEQIGGKTLVWNQLCNVGTRTGTGSSITTVFNAGVSIVSGHKYYAKADFTSQGHPHLDIYAYINSANVVVARLSTPQIFTSAYSATSNNTSNRVEGNMWFFLPASSGFASGDIVTNVMLIDLTLMFGAGNEPSTVAEFQQMFPAQYYQYSQGTLLSAGVTEVVSKDSNNATLQTIPIPTAIRNLEGYGWSAGSVYNYVDFERKVFVQNVGSRAYASGDESDSTVVTDMTTTYYPLTTAVETDISAYLTDDNLISVESGGTLTFENQHGTDYQIHVPSEEEYMIDLQSAL